MGGGAALVMRDYDGTPRQGAAASAQRGERAVESQPYAGQVAIVTGAASGIGRAVALRLARDGAAVALLDVQADGALATQAALPPGARSCVAAVDVSDAAQVRAAVEAAVAALGTPAILVNCAGISRGGPVAGLALEDWERVQAVNLRGTMLCCQAVTPLMAAAGYGRVVNISSGTGVRVGPGSAAYAASKAGVIALTKALAGELASSGVTANVVAPGITDTAMTRAAFGTREAIEAAAREGRIANPMGEVLEPEDMAAAVAFFALPESRHITGQTLHVNAGAFMP
jgi:NAD(P)-dependent dehydrogenase (short-subunit alcohol dehydrogenase family)